VIAAIEGAGHQVVALSPEEIEVRRGGIARGARRCADLFKRHRDTLDGSIVTLPNFGEERAIADACAAADLPIPVLIQATPDAPARMTIRDRRDSFCGKMSACNNLRQYGIPYSLTRLHTEPPIRPSSSRT